jgi:hypothetical protein
MSRLALKQSANHKQVDFRAWRCLHSGRERKFKCMWRSIPGIGIRRQSSFAADDCSCLDPHCPRLPDRNQGPRFAGTNPAIPPDSSIAKN